MKIVVVAPNYPFKGNDAFVFLKQVVDGFSNMGCQCHVIAPYSVSHYLRQCLKRSAVEELETNDSVVIHRPRFVSLSNCTGLLRRLSTLFRKKAIERALRDIDFVPDLFYCHFWGSAYYAHDYCRKQNIPIFVATGESSITDVSPFDGKCIPSLSESVKGVIAVSEKNRQESISLGLTRPDKCIVLQNAVNPQLFKKMDRKVCRRKLSIAEDAFVVAFVGNFCHRKGNERLSEALTRIDGRPVHVMYIGVQSTPPFVPTCTNVLHCGSLPHTEIPAYLNAADIFVLPTLKEGCCNAIVEAMACGLPVISSDRDFNDGLLTEDNSLRIDPMDVQSIAEAIVRLRDDEALRTRLSDGALLTASSLCLDKRCEAILQFMKERI